LVLLDVREVRADERLRDVPVPELVGLRGGGRIRMEVQLFVGTDEEQIQVLRRPARADLGAVAGHDGAETVVIGDHARHALPGRRRRVGGQREVGLRAPALDDARVLRVGGRTREHGEKSGGREETAPAPHYFSSRIEMFRNWTSAGGDTHLPSFLLPWCCRATGPRAGTPGSSALSITRSPLRTTVSRLPFIVISNVFHLPMSWSASFFGVTPARTAAG